MKVDEFLATERINVRAMPARSLRREIKLMWRRVEVTVRRNVQELAGWGGQAERSFPWPPTQSEYERGPRENSPESRVGCRRFPRKLRANDHSSFVVRVHSSSLVASAIRPY